MKTKTVYWGVFAGAVALLLALSVLPPLPKQKARAARVSGVNNISSITLVLTNPPASR